MLDSIKIPVSSEELRRLAEVRLNQADRIPGKELSKEQYEKLRIIKEFLPPQLRYTITLDEAVLLGM